jgi:hypothetical protein
MRRFEMQLVSWHTAGWAVYVRSSEACGKVPPCARKGYASQQCCMIFVGLADEMQQYFVICHVF